MRDQQTTGNGAGRSRSQPGTTARAARPGAGGAPTIDVLESRVLMTTSTASLSALADASVRDGSYVAKNLGAEASMGVQKSGSGFNRQGYVKFDLTKVQGSVDKAVLRLYGKFSATGTVAMPVAVQGVADFSWGERTITWSNRPAAGAQVGTALFGTAYKWVDVDVTPYVALAKAGGAGAVSFALAGAQSGAAQVVVNAKESGGNGPKLVVTADNATTPPTTNPTPTPTPTPGPTLPPAAVVGLTASLTSTGAVSLSWTAVSGAASYNVYRANVTGGVEGTVFQVKGGLTTAAWTDATALGSTAYRYYVAAVNAAGEGPESAAANVTTPAAPVVLGAPQFLASDSPDMTLRYTGGKVTLPDGRVVNVPAGTLTFDNPDIQSQVYKGYAPQNYDGRPYDKRWQDAAANLMPTIDTITLGGPYHMVLGDSVVVQSGDGATTYVNGLDYKLNSEWGQVMNANSRLGVWKTGAIQIKYDIAVQRLDLIQLLPDGTIGIKRGKNAPVCPVLPEPDAGAVALAGIHINTIDGARRSGFSVKQRDVYAIAPASRVAPINPGTIPNTIAKLKAKKDVNIAFFGDSITAGAEASGWFHDRSRTYTSVLTGAIKAAYPGATITETMAHQSGVSATAGGPTWDKYVMAPHTAGKTVDLAIIAMGMNDYGKPSLTPYKDALRGYIAQAKAAGIEVLLVTPIQSNPYYDAVNTIWVPRAQIAQAMREVAAETGVACADAYTEWVNQGTKGVAPVSQLHNWFNHPGNAGMKVIANAIMGHFPGT